MTDCIPCASGKHVSLDEKSCVCCSASLAAN